MKEKFRKLWLIETTLAFGDETYCPISFRPRCVRGFKTLFCHLIIFLPSVVLISLRSERLRSSSCFIFSQSFETVDCGDAFRRLSGHFQRNLASKTFVSKQQQQQQIRFHILLVILEPTAFIKASCYP